MQFQRKISATATRNPGSSDSHDNSTFPFNTRSGSLARRTAIDFRLGSTIQTSLVPAFSQSSIFSSTSPAASFGERISTAKLGTPTKYPLSGANDASPGL